MTISLQSVVNEARKAMPRGWAPLLMAISRYFPSLQRYNAKLIDGETICLDLRESMCYGYFFYGEIPDEYGTEKLLKKILKKGSVFVDIGANIGYFSKRASKLVGKNGVVLAVEPNPTAVRILQLNTVELTNVTIYPLAVGEIEGKVTFYVRKNGELSSLSYDQDARQVTVKISTLDKFLRGYSKVDLIKVDVEGFELEVFRGAIETLREIRPIVYFELMPCYLEKTGIGFETFNRFFDDFKYVLRWVNHSKTDSSLFSNSPSTYLVGIPSERAGHFN